jgi:hypothetical protein
MSSCLISILVIAKKGLTRTEGNEIQRRLFLSDVICKKGHTSAFQVDGKSSSPVLPLEFFPEPLPVPPAE